MRNQKMYLPEGGKMVLDALDECVVLRKKQLELLLMTSDVTINRERAEKILKILETTLHLIHSKGGYVARTSEAFQYSGNMIKAFWVYLHYAAESNMIFSKGRYPCTLIFMVEDTLHEIIVCQEGEVETKLQYLLHRELPSIKCKELIVLPSSDIENIDEELFPDVPFSFITVEKGSFEKDSPNMTFHEIQMEEEYEEAEEEESITP